jgi:hypothetical protein
MMIRQGDLKVFSLLFLAVVLIGCAITLGFAVRTSHQAEAAIKAAEMQSSVVTTDKYIVENTTTDGNDVLVRNLSTGKELKLRCTGSIEPEKNDNGDSYQSHHSACYELTIGETVPLENWGDGKYVRKKISVHGEDDYESR